MKKMSLLAISSGSLEGGQEYASVQVIEQKQFLDDEYKCGYVSTKLPIRKSDNLKLVDMDLARQIKSIRQSSKELLIDIELELDFDMTKAKPEMVVTGIVKKAAK